MSWKWRIALVREMTNLQNILAGKPESKRLVAKLMLQERMHN
jgi:hypothetical protein